MNVLTFQPKARDIKRGWHIFSAREKVLGRLASEVAKLLMGKHKRIYAPHMDNGDWVVITDAKDVALTGRKAQQKVYKRYSGYPGGLREISFSRMQAKHPERVIEHAVRGMLPDNKLKSKRMARLKVFANSQHPYSDHFKKQTKENVQVEK